MTELHRKRERKRRREVVGVGGYQVQEQLRSPTPAVPSEGRQRGSRWAIFGRIVVQQLQPASGSELPETCLQEVGGGRSAGITHSTRTDAIWKL